MDGFFSTSVALIEAFACRLRGNQCRAVHFRWHSQHELAGCGLLRTDRLFLAVPQELFNGRLERGTQLGHGFTVTGKRMPTQSPHKPTGAVLPPRRGPVSHRNITGQPVRRNIADTFSDNFSVDNPR